jgi:D-xylose transport system ATP-binding protein
MNEMTARRDRAPLIALRGVTRRFDAVEALVDFDLVVHVHEVVALVGDNGAGKSTVAKVMAGVLAPDVGHVELDGTPVQLASAAAALSLGIATVFQDLALCDNLDVTANMFLGRALRRHGLLDEDRMEQEARRVLAALNSDIPAVRTPVRALSAGQRQSVAIARALISEPRIIVLDEPTAALSVVQTAEVLSHIERLRGLGLGVVLISHNMNDVRAVADRIEVMRHGRNNGSFDASSVSHETVLAAMTGALRVRRPDSRVL